MHHFFYFLITWRSDESTMYIRNRQRAISIFRSIRQMIWHKRHHKVTKLYHILDPSHSARVFENGCCVPILLTLADHYMQIVSVMRVLHSSAKFNYANAKFNYAVSVITTKRKMRLRVFLTTWHMWPRIWFLIH